MKIGNIEIGKRILVKDVELILPKNGVVNISGKNGSGKTLLLRKLHQKLNKSSVLIDQENEEIIENISVIENISLSTSKEKNDLIIKLLDKYNLKKLYSECDIRYLSGGEKRFIAILRALHTGKEILIFDEPSNDLDNNLIDILKKIISNECSNKLIILVTHDDRFNDLITNQYIINNNKLEIVKSEADQNLFIKSINDVNTNNYIDMEILKKTFKFDVTYTIINFILVLLLLVNVVYSSLQDYTSQQVPENYHDIFSPMSLVGGYLLDRGALPIGVVGSKLENYKDYKNIIEKIDESEKYVINYNLDWREFGEGVAYPVEVYNPIERNSILLIDNIINSENIYNDVEKATNTNKEIYNEANIYEDDDFKQVYIHMKDVTNREFSNIIRNSNVVDGNYFYISKESARLSELVRLIKNWLENGKILFITYLILLVYSICYTLISTKIKIKTFRILTNIGIEVETIFNILKSQSRVKYSLYTMFFIGGILVWSIDKVNLPVIADIYIIAVLSYFLGYYIMQKSKYALYRISLKKARSWNFR